MSILPVRSRSLSWSGAGVVGAMSVSWRSQETSGRASLHGGGTGKVQGVRTLTLGLEGNGVDQPVTGLGGVGEVSSWDIGICHDDSVELERQFESIEIR